MSIDDSFKKPGAVPFKWEIRPGIPKIQNQKQIQPPQAPPPAPGHYRSTSPALPQKLKPPPAASGFSSPLKPRTQSFRSNPITRSERWRLDRTDWIHPACVPPGCFFSPLLKRKDSKRKVHVSRPDSEPGYLSDLETSSRWSMSSRKSFSRFIESPASSSFSSYKSSPRPVSDAEWAGFGLF